jgi:two-component system NtrC family response regulator
MAKTKTATQKSILFIGDEKNLSLLGKAIQSEYKIYTADTNKKAIGFLRKFHPSVILLNLYKKAEIRQKKDSVHGLDTIFKKIITEDVYSKVIVISDTYNHMDELKSIQLGAVDYYTKPVKTKELETIIRRASYIYDLEKENRQLFKTDEEESYFLGIVGKCPVIREVYSIIRRVADTDSTVLVSGKSGTGKELVARAIHQYSNRKKKPFVAINCGAIPATLLESELFGHEKGSFTGAEEKRIGKLEAANHGTVFLDEIGELPILLQVKLLRFLQDRKIERVGGREIISIYTRIVVATNKDLKEEVKKGKFREDLFYRLSVIPIKLPPLKSRGEDILLLANYFLRRYRMESKYKILGFSKKSITLLLQYEWPGNIRELENRIRRGIIMTTKKHLTPEDLGFNEANLEKMGSSLQEVRMNAERELITGYLRKNHGHISKTAKELKITRPTFHNLLKKLNINPKEFKKLRYNTVFTANKNHLS